MQEIGGAVDNRLIIWHEMDGAGDSSRIFMEEICREITEKYGVEFKIECMNITPYIQRLNNLQDETEKPDIIFIPQDFVSMEKAKLSQVPEEYQEYMDKSIWDSMKYKNVQRGVPYARGNHALLFYNKKYFHKAPETFEEIGKAKTEKVHPFAIDLDVAYWLLPFMYTIGGDPIKDGDLKIAREDTEKVIRIFDNLISEGSLHNSEAIGSMLEEFIQGKIATMINGEWLYEYLLKEMGDNLGVAELPQLEGKPMTGVSTSVGVAFPWNSLQGPKHEALDIFIRYMLSEDVQRRWFSQYHRFPVNSQIMEQICSEDLDGNMRASLTQMKKNVFLKNEPCVSGMWSTFEQILVDVKNNYEGENYEDRVS